MVDGSVLLRSMGLAVEVEGRDVDSGGEEVQ